MMTNHPVYIVHLKPEPKVDGIRALKAGLKTLLRRYGLWCVTIKKARKRGPR